MFGWNGKKGGERPRTSDGPQVSDRPRVSLRQDFPTGEINDALSHLLRLLHRVATLQGAESSLRAEVSTLRSRAAKCTLPEDYETLSDEIMALDLGAAIADLHPHDPSVILREVIDAAIPIAKALRGDGPLLSLMRLREEADNPRRELRGQLHAQMERLAEGVAFLRNVSDVFRLSTLEIVQTLSHLAGDEGGARLRLTRIRDNIDRFDDVESLQGLRSALLEEASSLVAEATQREARLLRVRKRVEQAKVQVVALESALRDANAMALTDPLTGLGNRRSLDQRIGQLVNSTGDTGVVVLDVDHFKQVNDTYGHDAGDLVLRALSQVVREEVRGGDSAYRVGGEEFVVILPNTPLAPTVSVAERIRQSFEQCFVPTEGHEIQCTLSAGVTAWTSKQTFGQALKRADGALYAAKGGGRNRVQQG